MTHPLTLALMALLVAGSLVVSLYARVRTRSVVDFYLAGRRVGAFTNASAIGGDYISAASFLGVAGAVYASGVDGVWFAAGFMAGFVPVLLFLAAPIRRFGAFTIAEFLGERFQSSAVRIAALVVVQTVVFMYVIPQFVGAGETWAVAVGLSLPGLTPQSTGMLAAGVLITVYVAVGGMKATTWQQVFFFWFFFSAVVMVLLLAYAAGFRYLAALEALADQPLTQAVRVAVPAVEGSDLTGELAGDQRWEVETPPSRLDPSKPATFGRPGQRFGPWDQLSLVTGLMFGTAGLPHIIMRYQTAASGRLARQTSVYVLVLTGLFYTCAIAVGVAARVLLPGFLTPDGPWADLAVDGHLKWPEQAVLVLAAVLGGEAVMGFVAAGAFAAILSTIAGLLLAGAASLAYDLYASAPEGGEPRQLLRGRLAVTATGLLGLAAAGTVLETGILRAYPNLVAMAVTWTFAVAGAGLFPVFLGAIWWKRTTALGALLSIVVGAGGTLGLIALSIARDLGRVPEGTWLDLLGAFSYPSLLTLPAAAAALVLGTLLSRRPDSVHVARVWLRMHGTAAERQAARLARLAG